ncbi:MAG: aminopeptidase N [Arenicellales bacterium]|mgnify:FL=1|nr:aminopeptidase N [Arenicellales bacterium]MDP6672025.1 aminopeptidase N [Arenicellales bacterium]MDP6724165.1 aminopeptidase N [Arenicellales bacterium]
MSPLQGKRELDGDSVVTRLADYRPPDFHIVTANLHFDLEEEGAVVTAQLQVVRSEEGSGQPLELDGEELTLISIRVDGRELDREDYYASERGLTLLEAPDAFLLEIKTSIKPQENTKLKGLYRSSGHFCTQCEAEGFRRITYFTDRPDVLAVFTVTIAADRKRYPLLLSNGNLVKEGKLDRGRHFATWHDPFPKPSYLFALVAGDFAALSNTFTTQSGRSVGIHVYAEDHNIDQCHHALAAIHKAMAWDEHVFGREYDLDCYMVVAIDDFNSGAMENKGLNIFNSRYLLARPDTSTDSDFQLVESVIAHEYFHNWSGNRVTCRDWFQLSLKEGFTVYRDQEFSADTTSRGVKRVSDINMLRNHQFREDAGPTAHSVQPDSYLEISNFYTATVYEKGAEVVRMLAEMLGPTRFRQATDRYFNRYDGQAVTIDHFLEVMATSGALDLTQFRLWYTQSGTPEVSVRRSWDPERGIFTLGLTQTCPPTPGQPEKSPFHIPLTFALLGPEGDPVELHPVEGRIELVREREGASKSGVIHLCQTEEEFVFGGLKEEPLPSLLRGLSSPIRLHDDFEDAEHASLMAYDSDPFNRWEGGQKLALKAMVMAISDPTQNIGGAFINAVSALLKEPEDDPAFVAQLLTLPGEALLAEIQQVVDPEAVHRARQTLKTALVNKLYPQLLGHFEGLSGLSPDAIDAASVGKRQLRNLMLQYLCVGDNEEGLSLAVSQFEGAGNMTDRVAALSCLIHSNTPQRRVVLDQFRKDWADEPLVLDKWLSLQALSYREDTIDQVTLLMQDSHFTLKNPNRVRALVGTFSMGNHLRFHEPTGQGYRFLGEQVRQLDTLNPQIAARLATAFSRWRRYDQDRQEMMRGELDKIVSMPGLSRDLNEIVSLILNDHRESR